MRDVLQALSHGVATRLTGNQLATLRTIMAADRTLMAWVRTALSLQSFGFTIYKVLQGFIAEGQAIPPAMPVRVGLALSFTSVLAMIMGVLEYRSTLKMVGAERIIHMGRLTVIFAVLILCTGVGLFIAIATHAV